MTRMTAADAAVAILRREGVDHAFGLPGAAINPFYSAMRRDGGITHILARHVEGASHMAEGYTRARAGNIGVCVGTSGPAGTDMITGLYSASADSIPILAITGQAPVARLHKEDFQAVDIAAIAAPRDQAGHDRPGAGPGAGRLRPGLPPDALGPAGPGADRPALRRAAGRDRLRPRHLPAAAGVQAGRDPGPDRPGPGPAGRGRAPADRGRRRRDQRRRGRPAHRVRRADRRPGDPDPDGLGRDPGRPPADGRDGRPADLAPVRQRHHAGRRTSCSASATAGPTGTPAAWTPTPRAGRSCTSTSSRPRSAGSSPPTTASSPTPARPCGCWSRRPASAGPRASCRTGPPGPRSASSAGPPCSGAPTSTTCRSSRSGCTRR